MSYDVSLLFEETELVLSVEPYKMFYNSRFYSSSANISIPFYHKGALHKYLDAESGIKWLHGKTGADTLEQLRMASVIFGKASELGWYLDIFASWAQQHPTATWRVL